MIEADLSQAVAVTGGMASGKSTVCRALLRLTGFAYVGADVIVRDQLVPEAEGWHGLRRAIDRKFFAPDGEVDKASLRRAIFSDPGLKAVVEEILHPLVLEEIRRQCGQAAAVGEWTLVEVPLLYECGWERKFARVIAVICDPAVALERLRARDHLSYTDARAALEARLPDSVKAARADDVIDNSGSWTATEQALLPLAAALRRLSVGGK